MCNSARILYVFFALFGVAKAQTAIDAPIQIFREDSVKHGGSSTDYVLRLKNASSKPIAGYVVQLRQIGFDGKPIQTAGRLTGTNAVIPSVPRAPFAVGEEWIEKFGRPFPSGNTTLEVRAETVFVLFSDGSSWGDEGGKHARTLLGMKRGAALEKALQTPKP